MKTKYLILGWSMFGCKLSVSTPPDFAFRDVMQVGEFMDDLMEGFAEIWRPEGIKTTQV